MFCLGILVLPDPTESFDAGGPADYDDEFDPDRVIKLFPNLLVLLFILCTLSVKKYVGNRFCRRIFVT